MPAQAVVVYILVGVLCYALTDTAAFVRWLATKLVVLPFGTLNQLVTTAAILLWPLWLTVYLGLPWRDRE
jgi:hypothetical protein